MKNHEEFRRSVFEKAERYEKARKKRNKRIIETVSLCSLCVVIGISAFFAAENDFFLHQDAVDTATTSPAPTDITATDSHNPEEVETPNVYPSVDTTAATAVTSTTTPQPTFSTSVQPDASENTELPTDTKTEMPPTVETTTAIGTTVTSTTASSGVSPEKLIFSASPLTLVTNKSAEEPAQDVYTNAEDFQLALSSFYAEHITEKEQEMLTEQFDARFFEKHDLAVVYVEDRWESYSFTVSDGMTVEFSYASGNPQEPAVMALHFYSISKEYADETILVSYTKN